MNNEKELVKVWTMKNVKVKTNVGDQIVNIYCKLFKCPILKSDITLFEKYILGYKDYFYRINGEFSEDVRENRDKDYLPAFSPEGNDSTSEFSISLGKTKQEPDISEAALYRAVLYDYLSDYDTSKRKKKLLESTKNEKWTRKCFINWHDRKYNNKFTMFTAIYPFTGDMLSGYTNLFRFELCGDDEDGIVIGLGLFGCNFIYSNKWLNDWIYYNIVKKPQWEKGTSWEDYHTIYKKWSKKHPVRHFLNVQWLLSIGINRAEGIYFRKEVDHSGRRYNFNPLRTKKWNLI